MEKHVHQKPLSHLELSEFCNQISMLLHSGISVPEALNLLLIDSKNDYEKDLLTVILKHSEQSGLLSPAAEASNVFPAYAKSMMQLGEETGTLDEVLESLSEHYVREHNFRQMFRSALLYPGIMLGMMIFVVFLLLTKVMPVFQQVFLQLGQEMTGVSGALLMIGESISKYSVLFLAGAVLLFLVTSALRNRLPFIRRIQEGRSACRFADGMAIALKSGLPPEQGLELTLSLVEDLAFRARICDCKEKLLTGMEFSEALTASGIFTGAYARLAYIAGKSGQMDETMSRISDEYEHSVTATITGLISMLEPTLVIILSLIVGVILFSVMLPLLGIMSGL